MKKITRTLLIIALVIVSAFALIACTPTPNPGGETLTKEQQIQIAKDTFEGIYNASKKTSIQQSSIITANAAESDEMAEIEALFDKYDKKNWELDMYSDFYFLYQEVITQVIEAKGVDSLKDIYNLEYEELNTSSREYALVKYPQIKFEGVSIDNHIYAEFNDVQGEAIGTAICDIYYDSLNDFGFDIYIEYTGIEIPISTYVSYRNLNSTPTAYQFINRAGYSCDVINENYQITVTEQDDIKIISDLIDSKKGTIISVANEVEEANIHSFGIETKSPASETITIILDYDKITSMII